ncbi:MAG: AmpG family muropeptide MFS transporter [Deltaproteobacteria bacterium]|nr:AmpG family muropeptide MFS transporter [Deltaproteobacteria bacterium]
MKSFLAVFRSPRLFWILLLGFSSGIPLALTGTTLQAWMSKEKIDLALIGVFSLVGLPYTVKILWAPLMDRFIPPFLGRRRGWILVTQFALALVIAAMAFSDPKGATTIFAVLALLVAFASASQDIVVDAYRTEVLEPRELGPGASVHILGYRIAMLTSGAIALILADHLPWKTVYLLMAGSLGVGVAASLLAPEPRLPEQPPRSMREAVTEPFAEFLSRPGALEILLFIVLYKLDVVMATALMTPFILEMGFSMTDIGAVTKGFGMAATIAGTLAGGAVVARAGMKASLWIFGILQSVSTLSFLALARLGHHYPMMVTAIGLENLCSGMGTAAYAAFLMSLCDRRFTATQYALLTSLMALTRVFVGAPTGYLVKTYGWERYFLISALSAAPGLLLLLRYPRWTERPSGEAAATVSAHR